MYIHAYLFLETQIKHAHLHVLLVCLFPVSTLVFGNQLVYFSYGDCFLLIPAFFSCLVWGFEYRFVVCVWVYMCVGLRPLNCFLPTLEGLLLSLFSSYLGSHDINKNLVISSKKYILLEIYVSYIFGKYML